MVRWWLSPPLYCQEVCGLEVGLGMGFPDSNSSWFSNGKIRVVFYIRLLVFMLVVSAFTTGAE
jgi:hypothetical protein